MDQQPSVRFFMVTLRHGSISSSEKSCGTRCDDDFLVFRAINSGKLVGKEYKQFLFVGRSRKKKAHFPGSLFLPATFSEYPILAFL